MAYVCHLDYKLSSHLIPLVIIQVPPTADAPSTSIGVKCQLVEETVGENNPKNTEHVQSAPQSDAKHIAPNTDADIPSGMNPSLDLFVITT